MNYIKIRFKYIPIRIAIIIVWSLNNALAQDVYLQGQHRVYETYQSSGTGYNNNDIICYMEDSDETHNSGVGQFILDGSFVEISDLLVKSMPYNRYNDWLGSSDGISTLPIKMHCSRSSSAENNGPFWQSDPGRPFSARLIQGRYWSASAKPEKYPRTSILKILKLVWTGSGLGMSNATYRAELPECVVLTIPANSLRSDTHDFNNKFTLKNEFDVYTYEYIQVDVTLLPLEINCVNRDVMSFQWAQKKPWDSSTTAVYAGPHSGDMIEWRLPEGSIAQDQIITWKAKHISSGEIIPGPSGAGVNFWRIANEGGNDANGDQWLRWKPGTYKITCNLGDKDLEVQSLRVGYRSDQVLVIGQIVQTHTHDVDEPTGAALASWADAIADDLSGTLSTAAGIMPGIVENTLYGLIRPKVSSFPPKFAEAWTGVWAGGIPGLSAPVLPPLSRGPATKSYGLNLCGPIGAITTSQRYWMIQHMLNTNSDTPVLPDTLRTTPLNSEDRGSFPVVFGYKQYRFLQRFQARFLVDAQGRIENPASRVFPHIADVGPTKLKAGLAIGEIGSIAGFPIPWNSWSMDLPTEPAEASPHNGAINYAADGKSISGYASARIGLKGQQASYRQFGKDAPWVFSEVILQLDPFGKVKLMGRTSTTVQWELDTSGSPVLRRSRSPFASALTPGVAIFNNLSIYTRSTPEQFVRLPDGLLEMEGHLSSFVESASGAWPEPPIAPSIQ
jgi:hypothetical protein